MKYSIAFLLSILSFTSLFFVACDNDDAMEPGPTYSIPASYNFENVSYSGQTTRLAMFAELKDYMTTSRTTGVALSADRLLAMYANDASNAQWSTAYDPGKQMKSKTFESVQDDFEALMEELALASTASQAGSPGVSGVIESLEGTTSYLIGDDGLDHAQVIEKGLMGALVYYQATSVYFGADRMNVDNTVVEAGEGTAMEHHWDEAFGYLGVPTDFPTSTDGLFFWGNYSNQRDAILSCNEIIMDAMLKGRAAISNNDLVTRDEAIAEARDIWELIAVGSAMHYINGGIANFEDQAVALHGLSEAIGFIYSLKFNEARKLSISEIDSLLQTLAGNAAFESMNLYNTTVEDLMAVKDALATAYNLENQKDLF